MERWARIPDYPDYEVSDQGRVRSFKWSASEPTVLTRTLESRRKDKRWFVSLYRNGKSKRITVARVMLMAFAGNPPHPSYHACHNNGNSLDDRLSNLRWDTPKNNSGDLVKHGTLAKGEKVGSAKLTEAQVREIRSLYPAISQRELARRYNIAQSGIHGIVTRKTWAWL